MRTTLRYVLAVLVSLFACLSAAQAFTLTGTVYGGSMPMVGATITATYASNSTVAGTSITDVTGNYIFSLSDGIFNLTVSPPAGSNYLLSYVNGISISGSNVIYNITQLSTGFIVNGTVTLPNGSPAMGVGVSVAGQNIFSTTDSVGKYSFTLPAGTYSLNLNDGAGTRNKSFFSIWDSGPSALVVNSNVTKDFVLPYVTVTGKTVDANGVAVANVGIGLSGGTPTQGTFTAIWPTSVGATSDGQGNFTFTLPAGSGFNVTLMPPSTALNVSTTTLSSINFLTSGTHNLSLISGYQVSGTVTLPNDSPAIGVRVSVAGQNISSTTDSNGKYSFTLPAGTYSLNLNDGAGTRNKSFFSIWDSGPSTLVVDSNVTKDFVLPYVTVTGKTIDANGVAVANVGIGLSGGTPTQGTFTAIWPTSVGATSDGQGNFTFTLPAGSGFNVTLMPPSTALNVSTTTLSSINFLTSGTHNLSLSSGYQVSGTVTLPNGSPAMGVRVSVAGQNISSTTDSVGKYSFTLPAGTYSLNLNDGAGTRNKSFFSIWDSSPSTLVVDSNVTKDFVLPYVTVTGKTVDANGVAVGNVTFGLSGGTPTQGTFTAIWPTSVGATSDEQGNFTFTLPSGIGYNEVITPPVNSGFSLSNTILNSLSNLNQIIILPFADTLAPDIISGPSFRSVSANSAVVEWQTNEPSTGSVKVGSVVALASELATTHSVLVSGLTASTTYSAEVSAVDKAGNGPALKTGSFRTAAVTDAIAPVILEGASISAATDSSLVVEWTTNEPSQGAVSFGIGSFSSSSAETGYSIKHRVELTGLTSNAIYQVRVSANDAAGNGPTLSRQVTGRTLVAADTNPPVITNGPLVSDIEDTSVTVSWKTDEPSTGGVSWNDGVAYGVLTDPLLSKSHRAQITGLTGNKTYHLTVSSTDALGNGPSLSATVDFVTQPTADTTPPLILGTPTVVTITHQSAVVRWETDEPSDSLVSYGSTSALSQSESRAALKAKHTIPLVGLNAATTYQMQVSSKDAVGNSTSSAVVSFTTLGTVDTTPPNFDVPPAVGFVTDKKAVVQWKTDKVADTHVTISSFDEPPRIANDGDLSDEHEVSMTGLTPNKTYSVSVTSTDMLGNTVTQALPDFSTPPAPGTLLPVVTQSPSVQADARTATVTWSTDVLTDSKASYGAANGALTQSAGDIAYSKEHKVVLNKLQPGSTYEVQVNSSDPAGKSAVTQSRVSFTTSADNGGGNNTTTTTSSSTSTSSTTSTTGGSGTTTTSTVGSTTTTTQVSAGNLPLAVGWNLVGNGHETGFDVSSLFGDTGAITSVWKWVAQTTKWAFYAPSLTGQTMVDYAASKGYDVLSRVEAGEGFWVNSKQRKVVSMPGGTAVASSTFSQAGTRPLGAGWSLIATGDSPTPAAFNNALSATPPAPGPLPLNVTSIWAWDTSTPGWYFWAPSLVNTGTLNTYTTSKGHLDFTTIPSTPTGTLSPNTGVWVNRP